MKNALIIVDLQKDFLSGGALEVAGAEEIIPVINRIQPDYDHVAVTQDWHPREHLSFASNHPGKKAFEKIRLQGLDQTLWPDHCIWGTEGASFHPELSLDHVEAIFRKGMDPEIDSYSGFFDNGKKRKTGLEDWLRGLDVTHVHIAGLAAEICAAFTASDAAALGFDTVLLLDATKPLSQKDFESCRQSLKSQGVQLLDSKEALS